MNLSNSFNFRLCTGLGSLCSLSLYLFVFIEGVWQTLVVVFTNTFNNVWIVAAITVCGPDSQMQVGWWPTYLSVQTTASAVCYSIIFIFIYSECHHQILHVPKWLLNSQCWLRDWSLQTGLEWPWYIFIKTWWNSPMRQFLVILICILLFSLQYFKTKGHLLLNQMPCSNQYRP